MSQRIYDRIREIIEKTPGLTQKGLAEQMGLNPAAVNRMLYGRRNIMADEIPIIENYLGVRLELSAPVVPVSIEYRQDNRASTRPLPSPPEAKLSAQMVPVYGHASIRGEAVDWVARHPAQAGNTNAFAVYVFSGEMEPRYYRGELVYIHPGRPPEMSRDCLIEMKTGEILLRRFLHQGEDAIRVAQLNPPQEQEILHEEIKAIYAVVGRG